MRRAASFLLFLLAAVPVVSNRPVVADEPQSPENEVRALLAEENPEQRTLRIARIAGGKPEIERVVAALAAGWTWSQSAPKGMVSWKRKGPTGVNTVFAHIPEAYDAEFPWPVLLWLHGGVSRPLDGTGETGIQTFAGAADRREFLLLAPSGREGTEWWTPGGVELVRESLAELARRYRVDSDRVLVAGHSDGGSGCFHLALHDPDPYAAFVSSVGNPLVTATAGGPVFQANFAARPLLAWNGGRDPLYPAAEMKPIMEALRRDGMDLSWSEIPEGGHDLEAFFDRAEEVFSFWRVHHRNPVPQQVSFETSVPEREGRRAWVEILEASPEAAAAEGFDSTLLPFQAPSRPRLGITLDPEHEGEGVYVAEVMKGSAAAEAGIQPGDVLVRAGSVALSGAAGAVALRQYLSSLGDAEGEFTLLRDGETRVVRARPRAQAPEVPPGVGYGAPSARVEAKAVAPGKIEIRTRGVKALRIHLAEPVWKPGAPLQVVVNGTVRYEGTPEPDVVALLADAVRSGPLAYPWRARVVVRP